MEIECETRIHGWLIRSRPVEVGRQFEVIELDPFYQRYLLRYTLIIRSDGIGVVSELAKPRMPVSTTRLTKRDDIEAFFMPSKIPGVTYTFRCI